jgi:cytochrome c oxidase subunit 3
MSLWWADLIVESVVLKQYSQGSRINTRGGMVLFIVSEIMFFASFFWAFFHLSFDPAIEIGGVWPPVAIQHSIGNVFVIPLVNTVLLLSSGVLVSWTHAIIHINEESYDEAFFGLFGTLALAVNFLAWQIYEFLYSPIGINDSVYGSTFYMLTGFHGFHVLIGTVFLIVCTVRQRYNHFLVKADGLDCAIWYWHFVDVVWLFLFIFVYLWGSHVI